MAKQELQNIANAIEDIGYNGSINVTLAPDTDTWNEWVAQSNLIYNQLERIANALELKNVEEA